MPRWPAQVLLLLLAAVLVLPVFALAGAWLGFDAAARFPWRLGKPAGEEHVVFGLELADGRLEALHVAFDFADRRHGAISAWQQEPHEREPQLARMRDGSIVDQHFGLIRRPDNFEQIAQSGRIA